jgi:tRNA 2-thiocytidine biosynthesis protein TtcA
MKLHGLEKRIYRLVGKACAEYRMLDEGVKVLVCLSGGKDSYTLYRFLKIRQAHIPVQVTLYPMIVDCGFKPEDIAWLREHIAQLGDELIVTSLVYEQKPENCFVCSWYRRKVFFEKARELGCVKVALGHHLDDITQTVLMNMALHGKIGSMCPSMTFFNGEMDVIRPLAFVPEEDIIAYCKQESYRPLVYDCSLNGTTKRADMKAVLRSMREAFPHHDVRMNIFNALRSENIRREYLHDADKPVDLKSQRDAAGGI